MKTNPTIIELGVVGPGGSQLDLAVGDVIIDNDERCGGSILVSGIEPQPASGTYLVTGHWLSGRLPGEVTLRFDLDEFSFAGKLRGEPSEPKREMESAMRQGRAPTPQEAEEILDAVFAPLEGEDSMTRQLAEIKDWLWPDQTGMPNEHRNALVAFKMREKLLKQRIARKAEALTNLKSDIEQIYTGFRQTRRCIAGESGPEYDRVRAQELCYKDMLRRVEAARQDA